jgi:hypothetical protein
MPGQFLMFYDRDLVDKDGKVFNADGVDVTKKVPYNIAIQAIPFFVIVVVLNSYTREYARLFTLAFGKEYESFLYSLRDILIILEPYLVIHLYFFIKNLPISAMFRYMQGRNSNTTIYQSRAIHNGTHSNSRNDHYYNPNHSSYGGNIFHK